MSGKGGGGGCSGYQYPEPSNVYTIEVSGTMGVGKSSLILQMDTHSFFDLDIDPTIEHRFQKSFNIENENCLLEVNEEVGQEEFTQMTSSWPKPKRGHIFMYSITSRRSFEEADIYKEKLRRIEMLTEKGPHPLVLCGHKSDLESDRVVTFDEGMKKALEWEVPFFETSAKRGINVEEAFFTLVREIKRIEAPPSHRVNEKDGNCILQ